MRTMKRAAPDLVAIADLIDNTPAAQGASTRAELLDAAREWTDCGFSAADVHGWLDAGCFVAPAAAYMEDHGVTPAMGALIRNGETVASAVVHNRILRDELKALVPQLAAEIGG